MEGEYLVCCRVELFIFERKETLESFVGCREQPSVIGPMVVVHFELMVCRFHPGEPTDSLTDHPSPKVFSFRIQGFTRKLPEQNEHLRILFVKAPPVFKPDPLNEVERCLFQIALVGVEFKTRNNRAPDLLSLNFTQRPSGSLPYTASFISLAIALRILSISF